MAKYLIVATYTADGMKGVLREGGSARRSTIADIVKNLDGSLEAFYFAFGVNDVYSIVDLPDNVTAAAMAMHISAAGMCRCDVTALLTPEEIDKSARTKMWFRPPGA
ncbi:MAG: GYD domain protein [Betaproteobacteria bacterium RIFCSPLOWO2_12_FULL_63_13]|nr:MAG: GYD domain protein [Betaproteobacteria bacterium RIFCSPLOWO2_02_FULL_63_19]OGA44200.1 MAG: GYD domain protein [Betaproteobacteria bacterium RIFCSPLOWO2_12_FULL_63_13]